MKHHEKFHTYSNHISDPNSVTSEILNINLKELRLFQEVIFNDLDEKKFGINWWKESKSLDFARRILIADQFYLSVNAIETNLLECGFHKEEIFEYWDLESKSNKFEILFDNKGAPYPQHKETKMINYLHTYKSAMNVRSFFTSLSATFDCLATAITVVAGIRIDINRVTYNSLKAHLKENFSYANEAQKDLLKELNFLEDKNGPSGWIKWIHDYRNMSVHKGRRLNIGKIDPVGKNEQGEIITRTHRIFPRTPSMSEVEIWKDGTFDLLDEEGGTTILTCLNCTVNFVNEVSVLLMQKWDIRKNNTSLIEQPGKEQWRKVQYSGNDFVGFAPGDTIKIGSLNLNPKEIKRMQSASVADDKIHNWEKYKKENFK